jgi:hypothetical protein
LWQPACPTPLQIPEARSNSSLNKVWFQSVILAAAFVCHEASVSFGMAVLMIWRTISFVVMFHAMFM